MPGAYTFPAIGDLRAYVHGLAASAVRRGPQDALLLGMAWRLAQVDASTGDVVASLDVGVASGDLLTKLGKRVGEPRGGLGDRELRRIVLGRILAGFAHGTPDGITATWRALTGAAEGRASIRRLYPSGALPIYLLVEGEVDAEPTREYLLRAGPVLRAAVADGIGITATAYLSDSVVWSGSPGWTAGGWAYGVL